MKQDQTTSGKWRSNAQWPPGTCAGGAKLDVTEDTHASKEEAEGVCRLLRENGFGGDRKIFPIRVWVEPIACGVHLEEEITVEVKYTIRYPKVEGARNEAIKYAVETMPYEGVKTTNFGSVCVKRGQSKHVS